MTRETKVGLAVATTFLCLLGVVIASKLRRAEPPPDASADGKLAEGKHPEGGDKVGKPESARPSSEESEPTPGSPPPPNQPAQTAPGGGSLPQVELPAVVPAGGPLGTPPSIGGPPAKPPDPLPLVVAGDAEQELMKKIELQKQAQFPKGMPAGPGSPVQDNPNPFGGKGVQTVQTTVPPAQPLPLGKDNAGPTQLPVGLPPAAGNSEPKKLPVVEQPQGLPFDPLTSTLQQEPKKDETPGKPGSAIPPPIAPPAPVQLPEPIPAVPPGGLGLPKAPEPMPIPGKAEPVQAPLPKDPLAPLGTPEPLSGAKAPAAVPVIGQDSKVGPPPLVPGTTGQAVPPAMPPAVDKPPTIGTPASELMVAPLAAPGAQSVPTKVPVPAAATPAVGGAVPVVKNHTDETYHCKPGDTSFEQLSQKFYGTPKYAKALLEYNRQHVLAKANIMQEPPRLDPNQAVYYPPQNILEIQFGKYLQDAAPAPVQSPPVVKISQPMPLAGPSGPINPPPPNPATADPTVAYRVPPQGQWVFDIAKQTLGNGMLWPEILRLNPTLRTDQPIPGGTELRLPATAKLR
jgi:hypothetical protein